QRQTLNAAGAHRLPYQNRVEPTATSWSAGNDAEFLAAFAKRLADFVDLLGGKRPRADARSIGFANSEHIIDRIWSHSRSDRRLRRHRVRGGDEGIGAVVDIE